VILAPPPPRLADLPAGYQLRAGLGVATVYPDWDFETYSEAGYVWLEGQQKWTGPEGAPKGKAGLPVIGAAAYSEHPSTEVLSLAYDLKDGLGKRWWRPGMPMPVDLVVHIVSGGILEAHNAGFERWIYRNVMVKRLGWPPMLDAQFRCSMAKCRAWALPPSLGDVGDVLNIDAKKDADGKRLLKLFSMPRKPTKADARRRIRPEEDPVDGPKLYAYNVRDIEAEAEISSRVPDLPAPELQYWFIDQAINTRGVHIDRASTEACCAVVNQVLERYNGELAVLTGGTVARASEVEKLVEWIGGHKMYLNGLDEEQVDDALAQLDLADKLEATQWVDPESGLDLALQYENLRTIENRPAVRRALEIRQAVGSASVKKVFAIRNQLTRADRLHDLFTFHGARTGRPTGNGPQPTNLPNSGPEVFHCAACHHWFPSDRFVCPWCRSVRAPNAKAHEWNADAMEDALATVRTGSLDQVEAIWGDALRTMAGCLRGLFCTDDGHEHICADFSAIEAVVNAALAGEQWRLEVFRTHGKIYEASAAAMFNMQLSELLQYKTDTGNHHPLRKKGKVAELALGYLGWIGALRDMGGYQGTDDEARELCIAWRNASPAIVHLGGGQSIGRGYQRRPHLYGLEGMAVAAIQQPGFEFPVMRLDGTHSGLTMFVYQDVLHMRLPSGRCLFYHHPRLRPAKDSWRGLSISYEGYNTNPKMGAKGWVTLYTYAGKLLENACQAVANDILRYSQVNLEAAGYPLVLHVYDENVSEVPVGFGSCEEYTAIMGRMPPWACDAKGPWPIKAAGAWRGRRYRK
jgi:DNA polymerase